MKKFVLLTVVAFLFSIVQGFAQTEKGKLFLTGAASLDFNTGKDKDKSGGVTSDHYSFSELSFYDKAGYTVINNLPIGLFLNLDINWEKGLGDNNYKDTDVEFSIGPFVRYFIVDLNGFKPYVEGLVGFGVDNYKETQPDEDTYKDNYGFFTYRLGGGGTYFMNDMLGFDLFLGFDHKDWNYKKNNADDQDYREIENSFVLSLGIVIMLEP